MRTVRRLADLAVNFVFPPVCASCSEKLDDTSTPFCTACWNSLEKAESPDDKPPDPDDAFTRIRAVYKFGDRFQHLVHFLKYDHKRSVGVRLGRKNLENTPRDYFKGMDLIVPIPVHHTRRRERGYNQAEIIAQSLAGLAGIPVNSRMLVRTRRTGTQTALTRGERARNIGRAFRIKGEVRGMRILVVDDVFTTGATVNECAKVLMEAGAAEVRVLAAARV